MITVTKVKTPSFEKLKNKSGDDATKIKTVYDAWDKCARKKNFDECERIEHIIKKVHDKHGINET